MAVSELYKYDIVDVDLDRGTIHRSFLNHPIGLGDSSADRFGVRIFKGGQLITLPSSGTVCMGFFMAPDGQNILITGSDTTYVDVANSVALVQLTQACYNVEGQFSLAIKIVNSGMGIASTLRIVDGVVANTGVSDPVTCDTVPTYQEVLSAFDDAIAAVATANQALDTANAAQSTADTATANISNIKNNVVIHAVDLSKIGGTYVNGYDPADDDTFLYPFYQKKTGGTDFHLSSWDGYIWLRTPLFKIYNGQKITAGASGVHVLYFSAPDLGSYLGHEPIAAGSTLTISATALNGRKYIALCNTYAPSAWPSADTVVATIDRCVYYTENSLFVDEKLTDGYDDLSLTANYKTNGLFAIGCNSVVRGIAYAYDGWVLYTDRPAYDDIIPIAIATNGRDADFACQLCMTLNRGTNTATIFAMWSKHESAYSIDTVTLNRTLEGNLNGIRGYVKNNKLEITYVYEGEIRGAFGDVSAYYQALYDRMEQVTGCVVQTGTGSNISYYGRGFKNYEDYYSFAKRMGDDAMIANHETRIEALEEGGGGGGGGGETDWAKGVDMLTFGQEYMYAIVNKFANSSAFKVLFAGDSTTAGVYGSGMLADADKIHNVLSAIMTSAGKTNGTYVNRGVSGINTSTWKDSYLAGDIAEAPDLYIIRHGFNPEPGDTEDERVENFRIAMNAALSTIRQTLTVHNCSVVLMSPNTSNDDENSRGISIHKKVDSVLRTLARTYGCGYIDTFRTWYDPGTMVADMYDNPYGDGRHIHPGGLMNKLIASRIFEFVCPAAFR